MRGEHRKILSVVNEYMGSSPHARGALMASRSWMPASRIIPACAGSTELHMAKTKPVRDHPRMRGEHKLL